MTDFDYIKWILDESYQCKGPEALTMVEEKGSVKRPHRVTINCKGCSNIALYRFDCEERGDFLPFFNDSDGAQAFLNSFCDYIILTEVERQLIVFLVEMKRGGAQKAEMQIEASQEFMRYILRSADRIKTDNGVPDFDPDKVEFRKIILKQAVCVQKETRPKDFQFDRYKPFTYTCYKDFLIHKPV